MLELEIQTIAAFLAQEFNKACAATPGVGSAAKKLVFLKCHMHGAPGGAEFDHNGGKPVYFGMEKRIIGSYEKSSNNFGYTSEAFSETLGAFGHYTWIATKGERMVVDLQGVRDKENDKYCLTDPVIHCTTHERFGISRICWRMIWGASSRPTCALCGALGLSPWGTVFEK